MALLRLDLQIDSDVYPELYARLASIGRAGAREEKLRQLAATGLVWELVRMHGPALADLGPPIPAAGPPGTVLIRPEDLDGEAMPSTPGLLAEAEPASRAASREGPGPKAVRRTPRSSTSPGVAPAPDLGISVPPVQPPLPEEAAPLPAVPMNLPVLLDVVDDADPLPLPLTLPEEVPSVTMATVVALRGDVDQPEVLDAGTEEAPPPALVPRTGRSSRLKRMKDKGLFQNG